MNKTPRTPAATAERLLRKHGNSAGNVARHCYKNANTQAALRFWAAVIPYVRYLAAEQEKQNAEHKSTDEQVPE